MGKEKTSLTKLFSFAAIAGNILFILWVTVNGLKEHFQETIYEKLSYIGLMGLLLLNTVLIIQCKKK